MDTKFGPDDDKRHFWVTGRKYLMISEEEYVMVPGYAEVHANVDGEMRHIFLKEVKE